MAHDRRLAGFDRGLNPGTAASEPRVFQQPSGFDLDNYGEKRVSFH